MFLIIDRDDGQEGMEEADEQGGFTTDELIYTGLTRARQNLIVINFGNHRYHEFFSRYMDECYNSAPSGMDYEAAFLQVSLSKK